MHVSVGACALMRACVLVRVSDPRLAMASKTVAHIADDVRVPFLRRLGKQAERLRAARVEMHVVATVVEATAAPMSTRDPLRPFMDMIYKQVGGSLARAAFYLMQGRMRCDIIQG